MSARTLTPSPVTLHTADDHGTHSKFTKIKANQERSGQRYVLRELYLDLGVLGGEAVDDVPHAGVPGGAEEAAGHGRLVHAEDVRLADVLHVRQRHGAHQRLHEQEGVVVRRLPRQRRHDHGDGAPQVRLDGVAAGERARQRDNLERRPGLAAAVVVAQQLLLRQRLGPNITLRRTW